MKSSNLASYCRKLLPGQLSGRGQMDALVAAILVPGAWLDALGFDSEPEPAERGSWDWANVWVRMSSGKPNSFKTASKYLGGIGFLGGIACKLASGYYQFRGR
jgi:hypothetical protein